MIEPDVTPVHRPSAQQSSRPAPVRAAARTALVVHPDPERLSGLVRAARAAQFEAVAVGSFEEAAAALAGQRPDVAIARLPARPSALLDGIEELAPGTPLVLLASRAERAALLEAIGEGRAIFPVDEAASPEAAVARATGVLQPRGAVRVVGARIEASLGPSLFPELLPVLDLSSRGFAVTVPASTAVARLMPGASLRGVALYRDGAAVLQDVEARVRNLRLTAVDGREEYRIGVELGPRGAAPIEVERDDVRILALIREALRTRTLRIRPANDPAALPTEVEASVDAESGLLRARPRAAMGLIGRDVADFSFAVNGCSYNFFAPVDRAEPQAEIACALPRAMRVQRRRAAERSTHVDGLQIVAASPFGGESLARQVLDVTSQGCSLLIGASEPFPVGSRLEALELRFADGHAIRTAAVVRSLAPAGLDGELRCGLEFVGLSLADRFKIADGIVNAGFPGISPSGDSGFDDIWKFLVDTQFLYPEKLQRLAPVLPEVRHTLTQLIERENSPLKTLLFRNGEELQGHISAAQTFKRTWMVQHLAACREGRGKLAAARLLNLGVFQYLEQTPGMEWVRIYFRPNNKWPARVVGHFVRRLRDPSLCDVRTYAYTTAAPAPAPAGGTPYPVRLARPDELALVEQHFVRTGRLAELEANDLGRDAVGLQEIGERYAALGLHRRREVLLAERDGRPAGFALMEISSYGINFSELTNAATLHPFDGDPAVLESLAIAVRARCAELGRSACIVLAESDQVEQLGSFGFSSSKQYVCVTLHRSLVRRYFEHVVRLFDHGRAIRALKGSP